MPWLAKGWFLAGGSPGITGSWLKTHQKNLPEHTMALGPHPAPTRRAPACTALAPSHPSGCCLQHCGAAPARSVWGWARGSPLGRKQPRRAPAVSLRPHLIPDFFPFSAAFVSFSRGISYLGILERTVKGRSSNPAEAGKDGCGQKWGAAAADIVPRGVHGVSDPHPPALPTHRHLGHFPSQGSVLGKPPRYQDKRLCPAGGQKLWVKLGHWSTLTRT